MGHEPAELRSHYRNLLHTAQDRVGALGEASRIAAVANQRWLDGIGLRIDTLKDSELEMATWPPLFMFLANTWSHMQRIKNLDAALARVEEATDPADRHAVTRFLRASDDRTWGAGEFELFVKDRYLAFPALEPVFEAPLPSGAPAGRHRDQVAWLRKEEARSEDVRAIGDIGRSTPKATT